MTQKFGKRRAEITDIKISGGHILCIAEDMDTPNREYSATLTRKSFQEFSVPPIGTEVIVERVGEETFVTHIVSVPVDNAVSNTDVEEGIQNKSPSMSFVFPQRTNSDTPEKFSIEYREDGYVVDLDVDGDVTINAGGNVTIKEGGQAKKVLTEDAVFEYEDTDGDGNTSTKTTSTVSNGETTSVELE